MSFMVKDDDVLDKYNKMWDKIKEKLTIKFHSMPVYDKTYIKAKIKELTVKLRQTFQPMKYQKKICITFALPA